MTGVQIIKIVLVILLCCKNEGFYMIANFRYAFDWARALVIPLPLQFFGNNFEV